MNADIWDVALVVIALGSFAAAFINAAFATGGIYILLASTSAVVPLTAAVPLQSVLAFGSLVARVAYFWPHIRWPIVTAFGLGAAVGVFFGARVFVSLSEDAIALLLGILLLVLIWFPAINWRSSVKHPFFFVGAIHSFIGTLFGVGALLQPVMLRTELVKLQILSTLAACLITMDVFKIAGYMAYGFDYLAYAPHIVLATVMGFAGTWAGKRVTHRISERTFRLVYKLLITGVAIRLLVKGVLG
jgi:uncharacterized membrane protein YfcA